ncbi:thiaminase II [Salinicoccus carnicancri]|uniref:thiaminase II n=1 Tax=Salinicoccus carnicancri TaxID=558170 RepID=UPI0004760CBE|nr:thiaminase II [Salinicoccus carnicancri]
MNSQFTDRIWKRVEPLWNNYLDHPFVKGLGEGWLEEEKFRHWLKQDYVYLIDYSRLFALGSAKAHNLATMNEFSKLLHGTLFMEMDLHREYAEKFGISREDLENTGAAATTTAYTSYMLNVAQRGSIEHVAATVLACAWSYNFIGLKLSQIEGALDHELYGNWVQTYSSEEFTDLAESCKQLMNTLAEDKPERELAELEEIIYKTSMFEYMFWDMAENMETWPVKES